MGNALKHGEISNDCLGEKLSNYQSNVFVYAPSYNILINGDVELNSYPNNKSQGAGGYNILKKMFKAIYTLLRTHSNYIWALLCILFVGL